ncbi:MAG: thiolase family protein [Alphaproteobacteria bacterium]|nr:thiolase family protein [Alphaproteobacteria bacterium]MCB9699831.1 thiolase family protein [Alphaproteobacteria bacterium]
MRNVVIVDAVRTPIGRFQGALSDVRPDDLAAIALRAAVARSGIDPVEVDEVLLGCANQAGEDNRNVARMALLLAGFPHSVPGVTVNRLCASGLEAINQGARAIRCGDAKLVVAGGVESMSRAPWSMPRGPQQPKAGNFTVWDTSLGWRYPNPAMEAMFPLEAMGETAENIAEQMSISRADQDAFAVRSHRLAVEAQHAGHFAKEIVPVEIPGRKGTVTVVAEDEGPRSDTSLEALAKLKPAFRKGGTVTAGNSSTLNDGAAAVVLADEDWARAHGLRFKARIRSMASAGVDPRTMGFGPVPASRIACERGGLTLGDVGVWELNEAFAAQSLGVVRTLGLPEDRVNVHGGAIALGHPLGCSGARVLTTLLGVMARRNVEIGCATLCVGVGQGVSTIVEHFE